MLKRIQSIQRRATGGRFAIVAARYNRRYVDGMLKAAKRELSRAKADQIKIIRVPGSFEIPVVAATLAHSQRPLPSAILCFGVIFQGETSHARQIGDAVSHALAQIQVAYRIPVIHGVFLFENEDQARARCLGKNHNRGTEAARSALDMAGVIEELESFGF